MSTPGADDLGFELVPPDDAAPSPDDRLDAAAAAALQLADDDGLTPDLDEDEVEPLGVSWAFDWTAGRMIRQGSSPARVTGLDALRERCLMALNSTRFAHAIFGPTFGFEQPTRDIGELMTDETAPDLERRLRECLLALENVSDVRDVDIALDPFDGGIVVRRFTVVTQEEVELPFADLQLVNGTVL